MGHRSLGGLHALNFGCTTAEYYSRANDEILVVLQTESPAGIANAEAIYSIPGVDAIFCGPIDLRANMQKRWFEASDAEFEAALVQIIASGRNRTPTGMHVMDIAERRANAPARNAISGRNKRAANMTAKAEEFLKYV